MISRIFLFVISLVFPLLTVMAVVTMIERFGGLVLGFFIPMIMVLCVGSAFIFTAIDEACDANALFASLPIKKIKLVFARYLSSFLMVIFSFALIALTATISLHLIPNPDPVTMLFFSIRGMTGTVLFLLLFLTFYLPFVFKFGSGKGIAVALIAQIGIVLIVQIGKLALKAFQGIFAFDLAFIAGIFSAIRKWAIGLQTNEAYIFIIAVFIALTLISVALSTWFYKNKDI